jgi:hypothetical protein
VALTGSRVVETSIQPATAASANRAPCYSLRENLLAPLGARFCVSVGDDRGLCYSLRENLMPPLGMFPLATLVARVPATALHAIVYGKIRWLQWGHFFEFSVGDAGYYYGGRYGGVSYLITWESTRIFDL